MNSLNFDTVKAAANGRWREILQSLEIEARYLVNRHGSCPGCGGNDRWRFDDEHGNGTFICGRGGEALAGDGFVLLNHVYGWSNAETLRRVASVLGLDELPLMSEAKREELKRQERERKAKEEAEKLASQEEAARQALSMLEVAADDIATHDYVIRKKVSFGTAIRRGVWTQRGWTDSLLVPLSDVEGKLWSLEAISPTGEKDFLRSGRKRGCFYPFGSILAAERVLIGEGVATVAAAHAVTGWPAVAAMDSGNLSPVAEAIAAIAPHAELILLADNDIKLDEKLNGGLEAARIAALKVGGFVAVPEMEGRKCDFWDLWHECGAEAVREAIERRGTLGASSSAVDTKPECGADALEKALAAVGRDVGAVFEPDVLDALRELKVSKPAEWQRVRSSIKAANPKVRLADLDKELNSGFDGGADEASTADVLVSLAVEACEFFHDEDGEPFASFVRDGHRETWALWSKGYQEWLSFQLYQTTGKAPRKASLDDATATLAGKAKFEGDSRPVALRVAFHGGRYYLDLGNDAWQVVEVDPYGWRVLDDSPVRFVRNSTLRALPLPLAGGNIAHLWELVNIPVNTRPLVLVWLLECLRPETPYALLELTGEQGSAKSTTQSILRDLIDPNEVNLRAAPKSREDIFIAAKNGHLVSFENLSHLSADYQDALCTLATGGGFASRTLFTNADETVIRIKRPVALNGISVVVTAQDLVDRTLHIDLPTIEERRTAGEVSQLFAEHRPALLGSLLDLFARTLHTLPSIDIPPRERPRMADFALLGEAAFRVLGYEAGEFLQAYKEMRREGVHRTLDTSPVAAAVLDLVAARPGGIEGTAKDILATLSTFKPDDAAGWPKSPKGLGDALRRVKPALRMLGVDVLDLGKKERGVTLAIHRRRENVRPSKQVQQVHDVQKASNDADPRAGLCLNIAASPESRSTANTQKYRSSSVNVQPQKPWGSAAAELSELPEHAITNLHSARSRYIANGGVVGDDREVFEL